MFSIFDDGQPYICRYMIRHPDATRLVVMMMKTGLTISMYSYTARKGERGTELTPHSIQQWVVVWIFGLAKRPTKHVAKLDATKTPPFSPFQEPGGLIDEMRENADVPQPDLFQGR